MTLCRGVFDISHRLPDGSLDPKCHSGYLAERLSRHMHVLRSNILVWPGCGKLAGDSGIARNEAANREPLVREDLCEGTTVPVDTRLAASGWGSFSHR